MDAFSQLNLTTADEDLEQLLQLLQDSSPASSSSASLASASSAPTTSTSTGADSCPIDEERHGSGNASLFCVLALIPPPRYPGSTCILYPQLSNADCI
ncbi:hypothetical protein EV122DRAFT_284559 [Schizophyllum commune]